MIRKSATISFLSKTAFVAAALSVPFQEMAFAQKPPVVTVADVIGNDRRALADGLMARGLCKLALPEYATLAAQNPPPPELDVILSRLAECQRQTGALDAAQKTCARLLSQFPQSKERFRAMLTRGLILLDAGKVAEAGLMLDGIATDPAADPEMQNNALFHSGDAHEKAGETSAAEMRYSELVKRAQKPGVSKSTTELCAFAELRIAIIKASGADDASVKDGFARLKLIYDNPYSPRIGAEALYMAGSVSYNKKKYDDSVTFFRTLATKYPDNPRVTESLLTAAWANYKTGRYADAAQLLEGKADNAESIYLIANCYSHLSQHDKAIESYDKLLALKNLPAESISVLKSAEYERLVEIMKKGDYKRVLDDAALIREPGAEVAARFYWLQAEAAEALHDTPRAVQFYRILIQKEPKSDIAPDATYRLASELQKQESWTEASRYYLELVKSFPQSQLVPQALFSSGYCQSRAGQSAAALRDWKQLVDGFPNHSTVPEAVYQSALEQIRLDDSKNAADSLDRLLRDFPKFDRIAEARFWRAKLYYDAKEFSLAEKLLNESIAGKPSLQVEREANFLLGLIYQATGRDNEAAAKFQPLLGNAAREKFSADKLAWLSEFQFGRKDYKSAQIAASELLSRNISPAWNQTASTLAGRAYVRLCETNSAISAFRSAAEAGVNTKYASEAMLELGKLLFASNKENYPEAVKFLEQAATRANTPELAAVRARAYLALAQCSAENGNQDLAVKYYMAVALLFEDKDLVSEALRKSADILRSQGRNEEADAALEELKQRFPDK